VAGAGQQLDAGRPKFKQSFRKFAAGRHRKNIKKIRAPTANLNFTSLLASLVLADIAVLAGIAALAGSARISKNCAPAARLNSTSPLESDAKAKQIGRTIFLLWFDPQDLAGGRAAGRLEVSIFIYWNIGQQLNILLENIKLKKLKE